MDIADRSKSHSGAAVLLRSWSLDLPRGSRQPFPVLGRGTLGFALNSLFVRLITVELGLAYGWAIPLIGGVTPLLTFTLRAGLGGFRAVSC